MARRLSITASGLRISKPGYDAASASAANVVFDTNDPHLMQLGSGTFTLGTHGSPTRVNFGFDAGQAPLVFCGLLGQPGTTYPVYTASDATGFYAEAGINAYGTAYPAEGQTLSWVAFMRPKP